MQLIKRVNAVPMNCTSLRGALLLGCLLAATSVPAMAQIAFHAQSPVVTGPYPGLIAVADFDGDGNPDVALTNQDNGRVYIYSGNGTGALAFAISYPVGALPYAIVAADFDHDGKLDLAVANDADGTVSILLGHGDTTFSPAIAYAVGQEPVAIAANSFDPDGYTDLVIANRGNVCTPPLNPCGTVSVLRNYGDGTFYTGTTLYPGVVPGGIATGAFTAGGDSDIVVTSVDDSEFLVYLGDGGGSFPTVQGPFTVLSAEAVIAADFNGDGKSDLAISRYDYGDVSLQIGNGDGTFQAAGIYSEGAIHAYPFATAVADFDSDGFPDLALANSGDNSVAVLRNRTVGNGGFEAPLAFAGGPDQLDSFAVGDFNRDGKPDFVVVNGGAENDYLTVFLNTSIPVDRIFADGFDLN
jgi:hypothetical protein